MAITSGDIAIIGLITNGNPDDSFSILTLAPIAAGEVIYFTDNGWTGSVFRGVTAADADGNENLVKLTVNTSIAAGTVIRTSDTGANFTWTTTGSISSGAAGNFLPIALAQAGDQITALQSTNSNPLLSDFTPIFQLDNTGIFESATTSGTGDVAPGLSAAANNAVLLNNVATTAKFKLDALTSGGKEQWLAAINNPANWTFDASATLPNGSVTVGGAQPTVTPTAVTPTAVTPITVTPTAVTPPGNDVPAASPKFIAFRVVEQLLTLLLVASNRSKVL
jgi:hypothetical protein